MAADLTWAGFEERQRKMNDTHKREALLIADDDGMQKAIGCGQLAPVKREHFHVMPAGTEHPARLDEAGRQRMAELAKHGIAHDPGRPVFTARPRSAAYAMAGLYDKAVEEDGK